LFQSKKTVATNLYSYILLEENNSTKSDQDPKDLVENNIWLSLMPG